MTLDKIDSIIERNQTRKKDSYHSSGVDSPEIQALPGDTDAQSGQAKELEPEEGHHNDEDNDEDNEEDNEEEQGQMEEIPEVDSDRNRNTDDDYDYEKEILATPPEPTPRKPSSSRQPRAVMTRSAKRRQEQANLFIIRDDTPQPGPVQVPVTRSHDKRRKEEQDEEKEEEKAEDEEEEEEYEIEQFIAHKMYRHKVLKYEVKWKGYDDSYNTWEPARIIHEDCPDLVQEYWAGKPNKPDNLPNAKKKRKHDESDASDASPIEERFGLAFEEEDLLPRMRKEGYRVARLSPFPTNLTDWTLELRAIHTVQRIKRTDQLVAYVSWANREKTVHCVEELHEKCPDSLIDYYQSRIRFTEQEQ